MPHSGRGSGEPERGLGHPLPSVQVECLPCGLVGPAGLLSLLLPHPLASGHQGLPLPSKPYPASGRARGAVDAGRRSEPSLFLKKKSKSFKKKRKINIYKESYKAWLGRGGTAERVHRAPVYAGFLPGRPFPQFWSCNYPASPTPGGHHSPLLPRAGGCGVHPSFPLGAHRGYCMM